jgi:hypothetical protein
MFNTDSGPLPGAAAPPDGFDPRAMYLPALVCAIVSVALMRSGFVSFLFLVPLGYSAAACNPATAWLALVSAVVINGVFSLGLSLYYQTGADGLRLDLLYDTVMALGFTWIMAGGTKAAFPRIRTLYRFISAAVTGAAIFLFIAHTTRAGDGFAALIRAQAEWLSAAYVESSGADAARRSFLERVLTPEKITEVITAVALRGGALVSVFFMFFVNRQIALSITRIFRRRRSAQSISGFHVPGKTIWVLSLSLAAVLLSRIMQMTIPEIAAWNILALCAILFLAQGLGIALYTLTRRPMPPLVRLLCNILIIVMIFSPGINTAALGFLILLGIAENWLPLRAAGKQHGQTV